MKTKPVAYIAHPLKYESDLPVLPISMYVELFTCPSCLVRLFCELASHSSAGAVFDDKHSIAVNGPWEIKHYTSDAARRDAPSRYFHLV